MRKLERRALISLLLAAVLFIGLSLFVFRFVKYGGKWATFYGNLNLYSGNSLTSGIIFDRHDNVLLQNTEDGPIYNEDYYIRKGTVHAVGDRNGNISSSALAAYRDKLIGYNLITGTYKLKGDNRNITLTLDAEACSVAYQWLSDYEAGSVGVYNYKTGEILCMVSTPGFDPAEEGEPEDIGEGIYINRFLSATLTPGSIFKTVTAAAAIDNLDWSSFRYTCTGSREVEGEEITCMEAHGELDLEDALALSCNCAFSVLAEELGGTLLDTYVGQVGLKSTYNIGNISTKAGSFQFPLDSNLSLGWAGVGQYNDQLNPCSMMVYMGAVANGGVAACPRLIESDFLTEKINAIIDTKELLSGSTSDVLKSMMKFNVRAVYGEGNFPGLDIGAKTGTGEVEGKEPNATFAGFLDDPNHPYAFVVCVENGGSGQYVAAPIANAVLQILVANN